MELKARFDEENNMKYADALEKAGCKIIYGFNKYKVHSKATLITYKDEKSLLLYNSNWNWKL